MQSMMTLGVCLSLVTRDGKFAWCQAELRWWCKAEQGWLLSWCIKLTWMTSYATAAAQWCSHSGCLLRARAIMAVFAWLMVMAFTFQFACVNFFGCYNFQLVEAALISTLHLQHQFEHFLGRCFMGCRTASLILTLGWTPNEDKGDNGYGS